MKIVEYAIRRYGPLPDTGKTKPADFNLIYGNNEAGKTLTIDALIKLLFGKVSKERDFYAINRVEETPDGYVVVADSENNHLKLTDRKYLTSVVELSAAEMSNIFVIRNSDLSIANEQNFYTAITERLTGLRTGYIETIKKVLLDHGKLTPKGSFRDIANEHLKSRIDASIKLIYTIDTLIQECRAQDIDQLEQDIISIDNRLKEIDDTISDMNNARLREQYEKGHRALRQLIDAQDAIRNVEQFNESDLQQWRDNQRDIDRLKEDREQSKILLEQNQKALRAVEHAVKQQNKDFDQLEEKKRRLDDTIRPLIKRYEEQLVNVPQYEMRKKFFSAAGIMTGLLLGISLIGMVIIPSVYWYISTALLFLIMLISGAVYYATTRRLADVSAEFQQLLVASGRYNLDAESLPRMEEKIETFENEYRQKQEELQERRSEINRLEYQVEQLEKDTIPELEKKIRVCEEAIDSIKDISGADSIEAYREKLHEKSRQQQLVQTQAALLKQVFGSGDDSIIDNIEYWQQEISDREQYRNKSPDRAYDEKELTRLKEEEASLNNQLVQLREQRGGIDEQMKDVERKVNKILQTGDEYIYCNTVGDLVSLQSILKQYVDENETSRTDVLAAIEIFNSIQEDEQKKVGELFGENRPVSDYYNRITGGRYVQVEYDQFVQSIVVVRSNGTRLGSNKLSGGAYDQLYFAIRLALGEELLQGEKGFFILDDPFIKSDTDRLQEQIGMLRFIASQGWQILFFSAKKEVLDALTNDIMQNEVQLIDYRR